MSNFNESLSKFLSLVLRHDPSAIGLTLDPEGWANVGCLIERANVNGTHLSKELLIEIVSTSEKRRFILSADGHRIRANQGHSIKVDLGLKLVPPPEILFHGTATRFAQSIQSQGLLRGTRHHVHLTASEEGAIEVGKRYGKPMILKVRAFEMHSQGYKFFLSENDVWLTTSVPSSFLDFPNEAE